MDPATCLVCRKAIPTGDGTLYTLGSRELGMVHRDPCSVVVRTGVMTLGRMILTGANAALAMRAPKVHAALNTARAVITKMNTPDEGA